MEMPMDVQPVPRLQAIGMKWDMREDHRRGGVLEDPDSVDLIEADIEVHPGLEDVVVPSDEPLMAVHLSDVKEPLLVDTDVSEEVDVILWGD